MYIRKQYLDILKKYKDINLIKVITGVRRCGKSTLLMQFKNFLLELGVSEDNIIYMNFESSDWYEITNYKELTKYIKSKYNNNKLYILLDEIQNVEKWEKSLNSLLVDIDCDIYITGSNAYMLSSELTTLLAGRVLTLKIFPFSFKEYNDIKKDESKEDNFKNYLKYGGMPMVTNLNDTQLITNYLLDIKDVVLKNDVISRNNIKDVALLDNLLQYSSSVIGTLTSATNITDYLNKTGRNIHNETVGSYLKMLENAYIIYRVPRYSLDGKCLLKTQGKYYFVDQGIKNVINGFASYDSGSSFENIVYMELLRRGYQVYVGKHRDLEIDFIAISPNETKYYQICRNISDNEVLEREKKSLLALNDNFEKIIITNDKYDNTIVDGIKILNIIDFLLEE